MGEAWIIDAVRTPRERESAALADIHPQRPQGPCPERVLAAGWAPQPPVPASGHGAHSPRAHAAHATDQGVAT